MPEPDFDQLADGMVLIVESGISPGRRLAEQLRQLWNARGAADERALKVELQRALSALIVQARIEIDLEPLIKALDR